MLLQQVARDGMCACTHIGIAALAIGGMGAVGQVHEALVRQLRAQGPQHAEATHAAVKHTNGLGIRGGHGEKGRGRPWKRKACRAM